jgi:ATP-dependent exoDNAse (exonuclease V) alpha subunit
MLWMEIMENITYDDLFDNMANGNSNLLILGKAGCGKSYKIKQFTSKRDDIITVAPSGIAAQNINGRTIQSFFNIQHNTYTFDYNKDLCFTQDKINKIKKSNILIIDEVSMLRCEILDIINQKLKIIRNNLKPFGGMKLLFFGDMCQMEPVVQEMEKSKLSQFYPNNNEDYNFYNSHVMTENNYFNDTFDIFQIEDDFRHKDDPIFMYILNIIRIGNKTQKIIDMINQQFQNKHSYNEEIQYLTSTKSKANEINDMFIEKSNKEIHYSQANIKYLIPNYYRNVSELKQPFQLVLSIVEGMKIIFVKNINNTNGTGWVNGTLGKIKEIVYQIDLFTIDYVIVEIPGKGDVEVRREINPVKDKINNEIIDVVEIEQFPFIPSYAITIDRSQGLTLDKIAVVLEKINRPNQIYVALSRARNLSDIILLEREMRRSDIHFSKTMSSFLDKIEDRIIKVSNNIHNEQNITINLNIDKFILAK